MPRFSKEECFVDMKRRILSTELLPGLDLDEATLVAQYGISRTPMREVLQRLAGAGYVAIEANRGAKVSSMDLFALRTFFQTAPMVYAAIARLAAENRATAQVDQLQKTNRQLALEVEAGDPGAAALANHRFHALIGEMARNDYLTASLDRLLIDHTRLGKVFYQPASELERERIGKAIEQHEGMIRAIERREPGRAVDLALLHWDLSRDRIERFVRPDPLPVDLACFEDVRHAV